MSLLASNRGNPTYRVLKMNVPVASSKDGYDSAMNFWKALERQYMDRRKRLMLERERLRAAKAAMEYAEQQRQETHVEETVDDTQNTDEDTFADTEDNEFSDVDPEYFVDPGAQYYSSLDREKWHKITSELEKLHRTDKAQHERDQRGFLRGCIMGGILIGAMVLTAVMLIWKSIITPEEESCAFQCNNDDPTLVQELFRTMFPLGHVDDEV